MLAVSVDPVDKNREIADAYRLRYPLLSDSDFAAIDAYDVRHPGGGMEGDIARPATFIIDRSGIIVWRDLTENWRIRVNPERLLTELRSIK